MTPKRSVMWLIGFCVLTVLGAALAFAIVIAAGAVALARQQQRDEPQRNPSIAQNQAVAPNAQPRDTFRGMITDRRCGARHPRSDYVLLDGDRPLPPDRSR